MKWNNNNPLYDDLNLLKNKELKTLKDRRRQSRKKQFKKKEKKKGDIRSERQYKEKGKKREFHLYNFNRYAFSGLSNFNNNCKAE
ncbi:unnamed protein product [marine sediment metagenome]|uniref:Nuclease associated modular domain-containing protein n=1 Tax=marine sediment metagenome TaxID=412755 RepID=X1N646_9ZZZZ